MADRAHDARGPAPPAGIRVGVASRRTPRLGLHLAAGSWQQACSANGVRRDPGRTGTLPNAESAHVANDRFRRSARQSRRDCSGDQTQLRNLRVSRRSTANKRPKTDRLDPGVGRVILCSRHRSWSADCRLDRSGRLPDNPRRGLAHLQSVDSEEEPQSDDRSPRLAHQSRPAAVLLTA